MSDDDRAVLAYLCVLFKRSTERDEKAIFERIVAHIDVTARKTED